MYGKLSEREKILKGFRRNMETRENNTHEIDKNQSANFCTDFSNGNTQIDRQMGCRIANVASYTANKII